MTRLGRSGKLLAAGCLAALAAVGLRAHTARAQGVVPSTHEERIARIYFEDNSVVAQSTTGREMFRIEHWSKPVGRGDAPVTFRGRFYYAFSIYLVELDPAEGHVTRRVPFPAVIENLEKRDDSIQVKLKDWEGEAVTFRPGSPGPILLPADEHALMAPQLDAKNLVRIPNFNYIGFAGQYKYELAVDVIRRGVFDAAAEHDPTNPWYHFVKGVILTHIGDGELARRAFRAAAFAERAPFFDYLRVSSYLARMGEFAESQIAFERGLAEFVRAGYEPELLMSAEAFRLYVGSDADGVGWHAAAIAGTTKLRDVDRSVELMERTWRLAPRCEGAAYAFAGMAEFLEEQDRPEDASVWYARAQEAVRYSQAVGSRQFVNASVACLIALVILVAIVFVKVFPAQRKDLAEDGGWFASWKDPGKRFRHMGFAYVGRLELLGIFFVAAAGFASSILVMRGQRALKRSLAIPEEAKTGTWAHPRAVNILNDLSRGSDSAKLLYCIAQQQAGNDEKVEKTYSDLAGGQDEIAAIAQNNLGVIFDRRGKHGAAAEAFEKALRIDPNLVEAEYNLGQPADSARVSRMRKYRPGEKLIALPDAGILASAFADAPRPEKPSPILVGGLEKIGWPNWLTMVMTCATGLLVLPFFFIHRKLPEKKRGPLASLAYVVPWTSPQLAPWGGLLLAGWAYCVIALILVLRGEFLTTLDLASEELIRSHFGLAGGVFFAFEQALAFFGPAGAVALWVANFFFLLRASRVASRRASREASTERATVAMKVPAVRLRSTKKSKRARPPEKLEEKKKTRPKPPAKPVAKPPAKRPGGPAAEQPKEQEKARPPEIGPEEEAAGGQAAQGPVEAVKEATEETTPSEEEEGARAESDRQEAEEQAEDRVDEESAEDEGGGSAEESAGESDEEVDQEESSREEAGEEEEGEKE